jgi:P-type Ca2+ transporter type 2C
VINSAVEMVGFTTLVSAQLLHTLSSRSEELSLFGREKIPADRWLELTLGGSAAAQLAVTLLPPLPKFVRDGAAHGG